jgi:hypothetical protein
MGRLRGCRGRFSSQDGRVSAGIRTLGRPPFSAVGIFEGHAAEDSAVGCLALHDPDILILDEPFSGLDVTSALMLRTLLRALADRGKIILQLTCSKLSRRSARRS